MSYPKQEPAIAVVIPAFNRADLVLRAIDSVLNQAGESVEVIVVDDGSTDGTADVVATLTDLRVRLVRGEHAGVGAARNTGAAHARSQWLGFLDSDDVFLEGWLDAMTSGLANGAEFVSCGARYCYPDGIKKDVKPEALGPAFGSIRALVLAGTFAVTTELFQAVGGYREDLTYGENTELGMRLGTELAARGARADPLQQPLLEVAAEYRPYDALRMFASGVITLRYAGHLLQRDPQLYASYLAITGVAASRLGHTGQALQLLARAWRVQPFNWRHPLRLLRALSPLRRRR